MDIHTPDHLVFVYNMAAGIDKPQVSFRAHDLLARIFLRIREQREIKANF